MYSKGALGFYTRASWLHMFPVSGLKMEKMTGGARLSCVWKGRQWRLVKRDEVRQRKTGEKAKALQTDTEVSTKQSRAGSLRLTVRKREPGKVQGQNPETANRLGVCAASRETTPACRERDKSEPTPKRTLPLQKPQPQRERNRSAEPVQSCSGRFGSQECTERKSSGMQPNAEQLLERVLTCFSQGRGAKSGASSSLTDSRPRRRRRMACNPCPEVSS